MQRGFTLAEMLIVITIIGILLSIVIPQYQSSVIKAKEAVLRENLFQIRDAISKYYFDKKKYPVSLEELVSARYLRSVPIDPFSKKSNWELIRNEPEDFENLDIDEIEGIIDIRSRSQDPREEGKDYSDW